MLDMVLDFFANIFQLPILIIMAVGGYLCFLIIFFSEEEKSVWKSLTGSERILLGFLLGLLILVFLIIPTVMIASIFFSVLQIEFSSIFVMLIYGLTFTFIVLTLAEGRKTIKKSYYSLEGQKFLKNIIESYLPIFSSFLF